MKERLNKKSGKLWLAIQQGKTKKQAALEAGLNPANVSHAMQTENFQALERSSFKEEILKHITSAQIAEEHVRIIKESKEDSTRLAAIKLAYEKIEPEAVPDSEKQKVIVLLK